MSQRPKPTHAMPGGEIDNDGSEDGMVNDSLGTVNVADSTGADESKENGDGKKGNTNTRED